MRSSENSERYDRIHKERDICRNEADRCSAALRRKCLRLERIHSGTGTLERLYSPETTISVSDRDHVTSDRIIASDDIITIDLSPQNYNTQSFL